MIYDSGVRKLTKNEMQMSWNEPGRGNNKNPWGRKEGQNQGPPDLDKIFRKFQEKLKNAFGQPSKKMNKGGESTPKDLKFLSLFILAVVLFLWIISGIFIVEPQERAVVTRFGKYVRTLGPGPHWIPSLIEAKELVNVEQVATSDHSGLMLTKDRNIASVGIAVQYRIGDGIDDVRAFLFHVVNPIHSLKQSAESALRQVVGQSTMDEVLTFKRSEIAAAIKEQIVNTLKNYNTGIMVIDVTMQFAKAPDEVRAAFDDVIKAAADEERLVNQARAYENEILPRARGTVERLKNEALGYKQESILIAEGNVQRFNAVLPEYQRAPKITQIRLYLDMMEEVFTKVGKVLVESNNLIYLPLDKLMGQRIKDVEATNQTTKEPDSPAVMGRDQKEKST